MCSHHHKSLVQHDRWKKLGGLSCGNSDTCRTVSLLPSLPERSTFPVSLLIILGMNAILIATTFFIRFINGPRDIKSIKNDCTFWLQCALYLVAVCSCWHGAKLVCYRGISRREKSCKITTVFSIILSLLTVSWELLKWSSVIKCVWLLRETNGTAAREEGLLM